ncbi:MAG: peptidoglycan-binding protein [Elusimicrobia bacterium]|nr:peptidoglycan-binding protein [Elusimicrobiota bacterium]
MRARLSIILFAAALSIGCGKSPAQKEEEALIGSLYGWDDGKVKNLQLALMYAGYGIESVDGIIGPGTRNAIKAFQVSRSLESSGYMSTETWEEINRTKARDGPSDVDEIQRSLKEAGFDPGDLDGVLGARTREQIAKFQSEKGLNVSRIIDPETWARLRTHSPRLTAEK